MSADAGVISPLNICLNVSSSACRWTTCSDSTSPGSMRRISRSSMIMEICSPVSIASTITFRSHFLISFLTRGLSLKRWRKPSTSFQRAVISRVSDPTDVVSI